MTLQQQIQSEIKECKRIAGRVSAVDQFLAWSAIVTAFLSALLVGLTKAFAELSQSKNLAIAGVVIAAASGLFGAVREHYSPRGKLIAVVNCCQGELEAASIRLGIDGDESRAGQKLDDMKKIILHQGSRHDH